jgi:hypothetical protein
MRVLGLIYWAFYGLKRDKPSAMRKSMDGANGFGRFERSEKGHAWRAGPEGLALGFGNMQQQNALMRQPGQVHPNHTSAPGLIYRQPTANNPTFYG